MMPHPSCVPPMARRLLAMAAIAFTLTACGALQPRLDAIGCRVIDHGISGQLVDRHTGKPITGARVQTVPPTEIRASDDEGCFYVERDFSRAGELRIQPGQYTVVIAFEDDRISLGGEETLAVFDTFELPGIALTDDRTSAGRIEVARVATPDDPDSVVFSGGYAGGASGGNKPE